MQYRRTCASIAREAAGFYPLFTSPRGISEKIYPPPRLGATARSRAAQARKITSSRLNIFTASASATAAYTQDEPKMSPM